MDSWRFDFTDTPPFAHLRPWSSQFSHDDWPPLNVLNALAASRDLRNANQLPVRFEAQSQRCGQRDYEDSILATGAVPTRTENWHDLLNALTWLALPHTKQALNAVQCRAMGQDGGQRGPLSDAATLFDESGLVLVGPDASLAQDLRERRWWRAFVERREDWRQVTVVVAGHAVLEKLLLPWPGITAKCTFLALPAKADLEMVDQALAQDWLADTITRPADLFPMPVLGVPGWWRGNEDGAFYEDATVFRPTRRLA